MFDFRLPNITGATPQEQMVQMQNYMLSFVEQLQWALNTLESAAKSSVSQSQAPQKEEPSRTAAYPADTAATFTALKPLIIKSADIVNAYYETIKTRLEGVYVAESDFGTYIEKTAQDILSNSTEIEQAFTNVQEVRVGLGGNIDTLTNAVGTLDTNLQGIKEGVENNLHAITGEVGKLEEDIIAYKDDTDNSLRDMQDSIDEINTILVEVNASIRSGLLYEDANGIPVYGLEVGQKNIVDGVEVFNKYARFTSDRLSFYDRNDTEVAYISDKKLYINNVEITGSYKIGRFVDTVLPDGGVVTKWV